MQKAVRFCQGILPRVSRSFALTIPMLDGDLYLPVLVAYLQDRLLDNFEDEIKTEFLSLEERKSLMDQVVELFRPDNESPGKTAQHLEKYASLMPEKALQDLTRQARLLREAYDLLEEKIKLISHQWLQEMNQGMQAYLSREVESFAQLDDYCYYVAGTVGGFLTDLILEKRQLALDKAQVLKDNFNEAGLFLQKVNIIRDIKSDLQEREKHYWPLKELKLKLSQLSSPEYREQALQALNQMLNNAKKHLPSLLAYYEALPPDLPGYRKFFAVNNALGLATLARLENNPAVFAGRQKLKVSKKEFLQILAAPEKAFYQKIKQALQV